MTTWTNALDSISAQLDLQRAALASGADAPPDLVIVPPSVPLTDPGERLRAIGLFDESERLADLAVARLTAVPHRYRRASTGGTR